MSDGVTQIELTAADAVRLDRGIDRVNMISAQLDEAQADLQQFVHGLVARAGGDVAAVWTRTEDSGALVVQPKSQDIQNDIHDEETKRKEAAKASGVEPRNGKREPVKKA